MSELVQLLTTFASREDALRVARETVEAGRAACVQILGPIVSVYRWQGEIHTEDEHLCLMKVPADGVEELASFVRERHPYEIPELTSVPSDFVDERYLAWAREVTATGASEQE